jgi:Holliday junction resolvase RusA-like endonuclease
VLTEIRQNGAYVSTNITKEQEDKLDKYSTTRKIKNTFKTCGIENIEDEYKECMSYNKNKNGKEKNDIQKNIMSALEERKQLLIDNNKGAFALVIAESINVIKKKQLETNNKSRGQTIRYLNEDLVELRGIVTSLNPPIEEYMVLDAHGISENYLFETVKDSWTGENIKVKSKTYNNWIKYFPNHQLKDKYKLNIEWDKPIILYLKFDCMDKFDVQNMVKATIDQVITRVYGEDDKIVNKVILEKNKSVNSYKEGKIYICIKNI